MRHQNNLTMNQNYLFSLSAIIFSFVISIRPIVIYLNSSDKINLLTSHLARFSAEIFCLSIIILIFIRIFFNVPLLSKYKKKFSALIFAFALLLYLQGYLFLWDYGVFDGKHLNFEVNTAKGIFEVLLWLFILFISFLRPDFFLFHIKKWMIVVFLSTSFSLTAAYYDSPFRQSSTLWHKEYEVNLDSYFTFSYKKNVIFLVVDSARGDIFEDIYSHMTEEDKSIFNGFTFFKNSTGVFSSTDPSVSGILTGHLYDFKKPKDVAYPELFTSSTSLPYQLKKSGFISEVYPYNVGSVFLSPEVVDNLMVRRASDADLLKLAKITKFNFSPHFLKMLLFNSSELYASTFFPQEKKPPSEIVGMQDEEHKKSFSSKEKPLPQNILNHVAWNHSIINKLKNEMIFREEPVFKFMHFHGAHPPFFHDENFLAKRQPVNIDSYKKQYKGSLLLTAKALISSLKKRGVYEDTMLVIMGDHGLFVPGEQPLKFPSAPLTPLILIKSFGKLNEPLRTSNAPVTLLDLTPTVLQSLKINLPPNMKSIYDIADNASRIRKAYLSVGSTSALEFSVIGDVSRPTSWTQSNIMMETGKGSTRISQEYFDLVLKKQSEFVIRQKLFKIP